MRVLYIADGGNVGGAAHSFVEVLLNMKRLGVEPVVINSIQNDLNAFLDKEGIENYSVGHKAALIPFFPKGLKSYVYWLRMLIRYYQGRKKALRIISKCIDLKTIDLIHTNSARNDLGCYLSKYYHIPHVMHIREFADLDFNCTLLNPGFYRVINQYSIKFIAISKAIAKYWTEQKGLGSSKMQVIYNGIHYQDISTSPDENKKNESLRMVITGGVYPTKGQHLAVDALCMLPEDIRSHFTLDVIGWFSEEYVKEMQKKAEENGVSKQIRFLGSRNDVPSLLGNYSIGLMCSRAEGFGRTTAEYMHARLGVVASDSGANPELIEDGETGLLFESGNATSLSRCLERYYHDRELLIHCSSKAQEKARRCYVDTINAENIYKLYNQILTK